MASTLQIETNQKNPKFFTGKRVHRHAILLLIIALIFGYGLKMAIDIPGPSDFLQFYASGWLVLHHQSASLYDRNVRANEGVRFTSHAQGYNPPLVYGPQVALFFAPFALVPFWLASLLWKLVSFGLYLSCCYVLWKACPNLRLRSEAANLLVIAVCSPALFSLMSHSQTSVLLLLAFVLIYRNLSTRPFLAGLAVGIIAYKPHFGLVIACVFFLTSQWRAILGAIVSITGQFAVTALCLGARVFPEYAHSLRIAEQYQLDRDWIGQMVCLRSFWQLTLPAHSAFVAYIVTAAGVIVITILAWRRDSFSSFKLRFALLQLSTVLAAPHAFVYDLVLLIPAQLFVEEWCVSTAGRYNHVLRLSLYASYILPMFWPRGCTVTLLALAALLASQIMGRLAPIAKDVN